MQAPRHHHAQAQEHAGTGFGNGAGYLVVEPDRVARGLDEEGVRLEVGRVTDREGRGVDAASRHPGSDCDWKGKETPSIVLFFLTRTASSCS